MESFFDDDIVNEGGQIIINTKLRSNTNILCNNLTVTNKIKNGIGNNESVLSDGNAVIAREIRGKSIFLTSDENQKYDANYLGGTKALDFLFEIRPKSYFLRTKDCKKRDNGVEHWGFLAQDVEKRFPQMVSEVGGIKRINYVEMIPLLLEKINELDKKIEIQLQKHKISTKYR